ncbi:histidine kinase dimerization/phospho-acceptor domain-containing protein [Polaromonas naphthalenivorans]|uniref:histidine kinase dimerization/phospho-acceptor domain-containing protein n=1 Tax=Polaromonas naphthalenivorans TaxID=216465 RepID=UPI0012EE78E4|nr:histidine kinase dimerization/phospho-acceptor domain-containing protein [Polaromonas naphthalenivorans]
MRLLASAYADKDVVVAAINQGRVMRILEKPFDYGQVRQGLREALQIHRQRQREQHRLEGSAAAMRETLGFLAHELNTPMATVLGYLETLKSRHRAPAPNAPPGLAQMAERRAGDTLVMLGRPSSARSTRCRCWTPLCSPPAMLTPMPRRRRCWPAAWSIRCCRTIPSRTASALG